MVLRFFILWMMIVINLVVYEVSKSVRNYKWGVRECVWYLVLRRGVYKMYRGVKIVVMVVLLVVREDIVSILMNWLIGFEEVN